MKTLWLTTKSGIFYKGNEHSERNHPPSSSFQLMTFNLEQGRKKKKKKTSTLSCKKTNQLVQTRFTFLIQRLKANQALINQAITITTDLEETKKKRKQNKKTKKTEFIILSY